MRVVYFSPVALASFWQRPHWMAKALLGRGIERVLWVEPYPTRLPALGDLRRPSDRPSAGGELPPAIDRLAVRALPIEPWPLGRAANRHVFFGRLVERIRDWVGHHPHVIGVGKPSPLAKLAIDSFSGAPGFAGSFFDAMDNYPAFYQGASRAAMAGWEASHLAAADRVQVSSSGLYNRYAPLRPDALLVPNGCDGAVIRAALSGYARPRPVVAPVFGYVGTLGPWFDWEWLAKFIRVLSQASPEAQVHLIGPSFARPPISLSPQVHLLGTMSNGEALRRAAGFEAGLIPFVRNELTDCVDPVKYYEYRALGRPVIATPFSDLAKRSDPGLLIAPDRESEIGAALARLREFDDARSVPGDVADWEWDKRFRPLADWIVERGQAQRSGLNSVRAAAG